MLSTRNAIAVGLVWFSLLLSQSPPAGAQRGGGGGGGGGGPQATQTVGSVPRFEFLGPRSDGRIAAAAGVSGKPGVYFAGAASGGLWKSTDGAVTWRPVFDNQPVQAIGAVAVSQTDPNIVWVGTGEGWAVRDMDVLGDGVYKSTDGGETFTNVGLPNSGRIGTIVIHPTNPNIVFVCALGTTHAPQQDRGLYRTTDGGRTWTRVLFVNDKTGCSGVSISQKDPNTVLVGMWEIEIYTWVLWSGGPGSGVHISHDGGATFTKLEAGLPTSPVGKIDVSIAPSDPNRMYALIQTGADGVKGIPSKAQGSLWRSDDGGKTWKVQSWDRRIIGRAGYYIRIRVSPDNPNYVIVANSTLWVTRDGGTTFTSGGGCGDCHDVWWDPKPGWERHYIVTGDASMTVYGAPPLGPPISADSNRVAGRSVSVSLPIGQMYRVGLDDQNPYWVYSDRQDDGSMRISSAVGLVNANVIPAGGRAAAPAVTPAPARGADPAGGRGAGAARGAGGGGRGGAGGAGPTYQEQSMPSCESGQLAPIPGNPNIVYGSCYGSHVAVRDVVAGTTRSVSPWQHTLDHDPVGLKYRCHWSPPLAADYFEKETVYFGCQVIFRTRNRGQSWEVISPDLSTKDPKRIAFSGGVVGDNLGQFYGEVVSSIYPSRIQRGLVWAGTNDGKVWVTRNVNAAVPTWIDVGRNITGLREWGAVRRIDPSTFNAGTAYASFDYHLMGHGDPYIYKTSDYGVTWKRISDGLPKGHPLDYVMSVAENPNRKGMLFAGTGHAFYYSLDDGATWKQFKDALPAAPVTGIEVSKNYAELAVSTYGRGIYILRDLWKLEGPIPANAVGGAQQGAELLLYAPRPGVRTSSGGSANFVFEMPTAPTGPITMEVLDSAGKTVLGTSQLTGHQGMNRASWNMIYPAAIRPVLRALPEDNPHIWEGGRFPNGTRQVTHWGLGGASFQPRAAPGKYQVRFTYNGKKYTTPFEIVKDPAVPSTPADLVAGTAFQLKIISTINEVVDRINRIEIMRKQVEDLRKQHGSDAALDMALADIGAAMYKTELHFLSRTDMHSDDKWYVEKYKLYMNLVWLLAEVGSGGGDVAGGAMYRPTDAAVGVLADQTRLLGIANVDFNALMARVATFNRTHAGKLAPISDKLDPAAAGRGGRGGG